MESRQPLCLFVFSIRAGPTSTPWPCANAKSSSGGRGVLVWGGEWGAARASQKHASRTELGFIPNPRERGSGQMDKEGSGRPLSAPWSGPSWLGPREGMDPGQERSTPTFAMTATSSLPFPNPICSPASPHSGVSSDSSHQAGVPLGPQDLALNLQLGHLKQK